jgi:polyhydroxyalkanoate synthase subunit PhaC
MSTPATTVSAPPEGAGGLIGWAKHTAARNARRTTNAVRLAAGLDQPRTGCTPHVTLWRYDRVSLRRYRAGMNDGRPPLLLVPSLINRSHIWDLRPGDSFVEGLLADGYDVFLIDWGTPDHRDADNTIATYVDGYLPAAYDIVVAHTGVRPAVLGHCFGGALATLWAASVSDQPPAIVALGVPTNWAEMGPLARLTQYGRLNPEDVLDETGNVAPTTMLRAFQMLRPMGDLAGYVTLWDRLDDRAAAQAIWAITEWAHDHVPLPGAAFVEMIRQLSRENAMYTGEVLLDGAPRKLAAVTCPFLNVYGEHDHVTPPPSVMPLTDLVSSEVRDTVALKAGHIGLLVGRTARKQSLPVVTDWLKLVASDTGQPLKSPAGLSLR